MSSWPASGSVPGSPACGRWRPATAPRSRPTSGSTCSTWRTGRSASTWPSSSRPCRRWGPGASGPSGGGRRRRPTAPRCPGCSTEPVAGRAEVHSRGSRWGFAPPFLLSGGGPLPSGHPAAWRPPFCVSSCLCPGASGSSPAAAASEPVRWIFRIPASAMGLGAPPGWQLPAGPPSSHPPGGTLCLITSSPPTAAPSST